MHFRLPTFALPAIAVLLLGGCIEPGNKDEAPPTYVISGVIMTTANEPVGGVTLNLTGTASTSVMTDALGSYSFSGVGAGSYTITPTSPDHTFEPASLTVDIADIDVPRQNFKAIVIPTVRISSISSGSQVPMALDTSGGVWAWGFYPGNGSMNGVGDPIYLFSGATKISSYGSHRLVIKNDGTVWGWGSNTAGQLGDATFDDKLIPIELPIANVIAISTGSGHSVFLKSDNTVWTVGANHHGQLGNGIAKANMIGAKLSSPVQVSGLSGITAIASGLNHVLALKSDGTVWSWGYDGVSLLDASTPAQVAGLTNVIGIFASEQHSFAIKDNGTVWAWGNNVDGQLADGTTTDRPAPTMVPNFTGAAAISSHKRTVAIKNDHTVWVLGTDAPMEIPSLAHATQISVDFDDVHVWVVKDDGTLWAGNRFSWTDPQQFYKFIY